MIRQLLYRVAAGYASVPTVSPGCVGDTDCIVGVRRVPFVHLACIYDRRKVVPTGDER